MLINFIHWNVNPEIAHVFGLSIRWYGVLFALSFFLGYFIMIGIFKKENIPLKELDRLTTYMIVGTVVGARLGHCFFYEPSYYLSHPLDVFKVWEGGLASHGAAIGILIALYLFSRKSQKPYLWVVDRIVIVVALSGFLIRTGNLMNSENLGRPTDLPWAFIFSRTSDIPRHPTQIYEGISYLLIFVFLLKYYYLKGGQPRQGFLFGMFLLLIFGVRFFIEFLKEPQVDFERNLALDIGQLLSIPFVIAGLCLLLYPQWIRKSKTEG
ncbi:MAG: prolipoprotein diacylglyceryl transferase [Bacteroidetes bacterium]|nr:prolipoprotein diacylglyceryl transferase [Bacteroidota bacterium]